MKVSKSENYRLILLKILCSNDSIIHKSKIIFETIFRKYHICPINKTKNINLSKEYENDNNTNVSFSDDSNENDISDIEEDEEMDEEENDEEEDDDEENDEESDDEENDEESDDEENDEESDDEENDEESDDDENDEESDDDENDDGTGVKFLNELNKSKNNSILLFLNNSNNILLDEVLLSLFDEKFENYFNLKNSDEEKIFNQSLQIFKNCVYYIEKLNCRITINNKLAILYCISYIKYYCYHLSKIIYNDKENLDLIDIYEFLNGKSEFRKIIKIYILKVLNKIFIKNYKSLIEYIESKELFNVDFDFTEKVPCSLNYLFLQNNSIENYKKLREVYVLSKIEKFKSEDEILKLLNEKSLLNFYDLIINEELSNIIKKQFNQDYYRNLCRFLSYIICKMDLSKLSENILSIYYNYNSINKEINFIQSLSLSDYEILLYSHKFSFICSLSKPNTVYSNILSPYIMRNINKIYIPGGEPKYNLFMKSISEIQNYKGAEAVYICSCGELYKIGDCGGPRETKNCLECNEIIGGNRYILHKRKGHVRICFNKNQMNQFPDVPGVMIDDLKKEVEDLKRIQICGFKKILKKFFVSETKTVRNISNVTYRILSFIFYSCIFYDIKLNYISEEESRNFYYEDKVEQSIFSILRDIWTILNNELTKRGVNNIQCFLNMIILDLSKLISENRLEMKTPKERDNFENLCNQKVENAIKNYNNYYLQYINNNNEILKINDDTMKSIIEETSDINKLSKIKYLLIKYFYAADYPSYEKFYNQFNAIPDYSNQYPVISNYLNVIIEKREKLEFLESFHYINPLVVYAIEKYSNKISRVNAKKIKIKDELEKDNTMKKLFNNFRKGWKKIYKDLSNYDCHGKLKDKNISSKDCLAYILNDNIENNYGKYIATAYKDFITYQNEFFETLINKNDKEYLNPYIHQIKKKIIVQNASPNEIVSLIVDNELFDSFDELIYAYSYRKYNKINGKMNYNNYTKNEFDFNSIEKELTKILLSDKKLFYNEKEQLFISYTSEGFTKNYNIISDFKNKIEREEVLEKEDKNNIKNSIERFNYDVILVNLQSLFLYFTNKRNINGNELLLNEIKNLPEKIIKLDVDFRRLISLNQLNDIKLNQLIDLYNYIEDISYDKIIKNVSKEAYNLLDKKQTELLNNHFNQENILISKKDMCKAVQKFI
eukprot:jgi/Orpsp1_1/1184642/evm.model.c7180000090364.1